LEQHERLRSCEGGGGYVRSVSSPRHIFAEGIIAEGFIAEDFLDKRRNIVSDLALKPEPGRNPHPALK